MIASLAQPLLYLFVLGFGLEPVFAKAGAGSYVSFIAPGVIGMVILYGATFSGTALLWDREFGVLKETLVAPVPRFLLMIGRTLGGATIALCQGTITFIICLASGFKPADWAKVPEAISLMILTALVFAALGVAIGSTLRSMQGFQLVMNFLIMPIFFLSGALFPLNHAPSILMLGTHIDPLSYGVDGLRTTLVAKSHFGLGLDFLALSVAAVILFSIGAWRFSKIEI